MSAKAGARASQDGTAAFHAKQHFRSSSNSKATPRTPDAPLPIHHFSHSPHHRAFHGFPPGLPLTTAPITNVNVGINVNMGT